MLRFSARKLVAAAAMLLALAAAPAVAQVPDPFARQLAVALAHAEVDLTPQGYIRAAGPFAGGLNPGESRRFQITLRAMQDYRFLGVCDARCGSLDLRLYDINNDLVGEYALNDAEPTFSVRPRATGVHTAEVTMTECAAAPCFYAVNVYSR
ncbi:MAG: hypothetical protein ABUL73_04405 [Alphaproteobacteria bacterium]